MSEPVTPAQEAVVSAMIGAVIVSAFAGYLALRAIGEWTIADAAVAMAAVAITSFHVTGHIAAWWLGRPLDDIMQQ